MLPRGIRDARVRLERDGCADRARVVDVAEAPEGFDFFGGQGPDFFEVEVGREGFYSGDGGCGLLLLFRGRVGGSRGRRLLLLLLLLLLLRKGR